MNEPIRIEDMPPLEPEAEISGSDLLWSDRFAEEHHDLLREAIALDIAHNPDTHLDLLLKAAEALNAEQPDPEAKHRAVRRKR